MDVIFVKTLLLGSERVAEKVFVITTTADQVGRPTWVADASDEENM